MLSYGHVTFKLLLFIQKPEDFLISNLKSVRIHKPTLLLTMFRTAVNRMSSTELREPIIALFSGSARKDSFNTKLAECKKCNLLVMMPFVTNNMSLNQTLLITAAAQLLASSKYGATTKLLDLSSYELPLYDQDLEADGMPAGVMALKKDLSLADGWVYCSPEYNGSMTPLFVNAMTWSSRGDPDGKMYATFQDKFAIVLSASPGAMGGMRSINPNRQLLMNLGVNVLPQSVAIGGAFKAFDECGNLKDEKHASMLDKACGDLFFLTRNIANKSAACEIIETHLATVGAYGAVDVAS